MDYYTMAVSNIAEERAFISILGNNLYPAGGAEDRNAWFYDGPPSIRRLLFKNGSGAPIGAMGFNIRPFVTPMGVKFGAIAADLCINKENRNLGAALFFIDDSVNYMLDNSRADFVYTIPNKNSKLVIKRTKLFESVGVFERHIKLISTGELLSKKNCGFLTPVVDAAWAAVTSISNRPHCVPQSVYSELYSAYNNATRTWLTYNSEKSMVIGLRDELYMSWRYLKTPDPTYREFRVDYQGETAHLVYKVIKNRAYVVDLLYPHGNDEIVVKLFASFEAYARASKHSMIVVQHLGADAAIQKLVDKLWYKKYISSDKELLVASREKTLLNCLVNGGKYWFAGDEDDIQ